MNDMTSSSATVAPPSSSPAPSAPDSSPAPSTPIEPSSQEALEQLSAPENVEQYAEQRLADEGKIEQEVSEPKRRMTRYERLRKARDAAQAEAAALREQRTGPHVSSDGSADDVYQWRDETVGTPEQRAAAEQAAAEQADANGQQPPEGYAQTPEEAHAAREQLKQQMMREHDIAADYRARERQIAAAYPDYLETVQAAGDVDIGETAAQLLRESPHGPFIAYGLAKTVDGLEILHALRDAPPLEVAKFVARAEAQIEAGNQRRAMQQRSPQQPQYHRNVAVTQARKPIAPLKGAGAGPTRSAADLAENMDAYAAKRLAQMRAKDR